MKHQLDAHEIEAIERKTAQLIQAKGLDDVEATLKAASSYVMKIKLYDAMMSEALDKRPKGWESV